MRPAQNIQECGPFVPHHIEDEDGPFEICWQCHGWIIGPPGRRLCVCPQPGSVSSAFAALRDALAQSYRQRWFKVLRPVLDDVDKDEARAVWEALLPAARARAARRLAERGLR
jgi:hypothetical protein